ncbi:MAG: GNAT family N-acetyltransferase, partial [Microcella sp.]|nr:GNAT family N-acetyltransferase [Microcella sp.]
MTVALHSERIEISPLGAADIPDFVAYRQQPDVARFQGWSPEFDVSDAHALIARQPAYGLPQAGEWVQLGLRVAVEPNTSRVLIGDVAVGCDAVQPNTFELGVTLDAAHQGMGYAGEALRCVIDWLMSENGSHRIVMQADARNTPVLALMSRLGLRHEGTTLN